MKANRRGRGFTLNELLIVLFLLALFLTIGVPSFRGALTRWEAQESLRKVTTALAVARMDAITLNHKVKVVVRDSLDIVFNKKVSKRWQPYKRLQLNPEVKVRANRSPVFSPTGYAAPLCTVRIDNRYHHFTVKLSMAGRVKVTNLK